ncbi:MAG TPA: response regulator [Thermoanaerobaculia bacterium]|nr:response regulator [Thermoanaerobaculia bacterium]
MTDMQHSMASAQPMLHDENRKKKILVIDDDQSVRRLLEKIIERAGFLVECAVDGGDGIQRIGAAGDGGFDLIILDLMMPNISGFDVIEHLSTHHPDNLRKIIVLTAQPRVSDERIKRNLIRNVIQKPFDIHELTAYLKSCFE